MEVTDAIESRRACRVLDPSRDVTSEQIDRLVSAMRLAPSCFNRQPTRVVVVRDEQSLSKVRGTLSRGNVWATRSPLILVVCARQQDDCEMPDGRQYFLFDCGLAVGEMLLAATEMDMIALPISGYDLEEVKRQLCIPEEYVVISMVICGFPGTDDSLLSDKQKGWERERLERKPVGECFFENEWGRPLRDASSLRSRNYLELTFR